MSARDAARPSAASSEEKFAKGLATFARYFDSVLLLAVLGLAATSAAHGQPFAYVSNQGEDFVTVIDTATNTVVATVVVGTNPGRIAFTPDGAYAYVATETTDSVAVIETATNTVITAVPAGNCPFGIGITPDGAFVYVTNTCSNDVTVINTSTNTVVATVPVGAGPEDIEFTQDGAFAYVANTQSPSKDVSVIDTAGNTVVTNVPVGHPPVDIDITPDGNFAYVSTGGAQVSVIDTATNSVTTTVAAGSNNGHIAITPDGLYAYLADAPFNSVAVIELSTNTVVNSVAVENNPFGIAITPDGAYAYVANQASASVSVIDIGTNSVIASVGVGNSPVAVSISPTVGGGDTDGDGIADSVDTAPGTASDGFDDEAGTSGSITDRAGLTISIEDVASPDGVRVFVGTGSGQVTLDACGFTETVDAASELIITCGSVTLNVIQGAAQVLIDGIGTVVSVPAGVTAAVTDNGNGTVLIQNVGGGGVVSVTVDGEQTTIGPGDSQTYAVVYQFVGFFSPVDNVPTLNSVKAGSAIPVKFSLGGDQGLNIFASGYPKSQKIGCDTSAPLDAIEETVAAGSSSLSYAAGADQYTYVWKTDKAWAGTCRQFVLRLDDSTERAAIFKFK